MFLTLMTPLLPLQSWVSWFHLPWPSKGAACQDRNCWRRRLTSITQKLIITAFFRIGIIPESCSKQGHFTEGTSIIYPLGAGGFCLCDDKIPPQWRFTCSQFSIVPNFILCWWRLILLLFLLKTLWPPLKSSSLFPPPPHDKYWLVPRFFFFKTSTTCNMQHTFGGHIASFNDFIKYFLWSEVKVG